MSADRYKITDDGHLTIAIKHGANTLYIDELEDEFAVGAIRQQARDIDQLRADLAAAVAEQDLLSELAQRRERQLGVTLDNVEKLRADLAAAVAENAALLAANRDCIWHFDAIKADYDVMKLRAEQAEARLAAIDGAPTVAMIDDSPATYQFFRECSALQEIPPVGTLLIARPAKEGT